MDMQLGLRNQDTKAKEAPKVLLPPFEADVNLLIDTFCKEVQHGAEPTLATFKEVWRAMSFSFIHQAVPATLPAWDHQQLLYSAALNRLDPDPAYDQPCNLLALPAPARLPAGPMPQPHPSSVQPPCTAGGSWTHARGNAHMPNGISQAYPRGASAATLMAEADAQVVHDAAAAAIAARMAADTQPTQGHGYEPPHEPPEQRGHAHGHAHATGNGHGMGCNGSGERLGALHSVLGMESDWGIPADPHPLDLLMQTLPETLHGAAGSMDASPCNPEPLIGVSAMAWEAEGMAQQPVAAAGVPTPQQGGHNEGGFQHVETHGHQVQLQASPAWQLPMSPVGDMPDVLPLILESPAAACNEDSGHQPPVSTNGKAARTQLLLPSPAVQGFEQQHALQQQHAAFAEFMCNEVLALAPCMGAVYCLHCLRATQPGTARTRIYLPLAQLQQLVTLVPRLAATGFTTPVRILEALWAGDAFLIGALQRPPAGAYRPARPRDLANPSNLDIITSSPFREAHMHLRTTLNSFDLQSLTALSGQYSTARAAVFCPPRKRTQAGPAPVEPPPYVYDASFPAQLQADLELQYNHVQEMLNSRLPPVPASTRKPVKKPTTNPSNDPRRPGYRPSHSNGLAPEQPAGSLDEEAVAVIEGGDAAAGIAGLGGAAGQAGQGKRARGWGQKSGRSDGGRGQWAQRQGEDAQIVRDMREAGLLNVEPDEAAGLQGGSSQYDDEDMDGVSRRCALALRKAAMTQAELTQQAGALLLVAQHVEEEEEEDHHHMPDLSEYSSLPLSATSVLAAGSTRVPASGRPADVPAPTCPAAASTCLPESGAGSGSTTPGQQPAPGSMRVGGSQVHDVGRMSGRPPAAAMSAAAPGRTPAAAAGPAPAAQPSTTAGGRPPAARATASVTGRHQKHQSAAAPVLLPAPATPQGAAGVPAATGGTLAAKAGIPAPTASRPGATFNRLSLAADPALQPVTNPPAVAGPAASLPNTDLGAAHQSQARTKAPARKRRKAESTTTAVLRQPSQSGRAARSKARDQEQAQQQQQQQRQSGPAEGPESAVLSASPVGSPHGAVGQNAPLLAVARAAGRLQQHEHQQHRQTVVCPAAVPATAQPASAVTLAERGQMVSADRGNGSNPRNSGRDTADGTASGQPASRDDASRHKHGADAAGATVNPVCTISGGGIQQDEDDDDMLLAAVAASTVAVQLGRADAVAATTCTAGKGSIQLNDDDDDDALLAAVAASTGATHPRSTGAAAAVGAVTFGPGAGLQQDFDNDDDEALLAAVAASTAAGPSGGGAAAAGKQPPTEDDLENVLAYAATLLAPGQAPS